jgi:hypothetical protein
MQRSGDVRNAALSTLNVSVISACRVLAVRSAGVRGNEFDTDAPRNPVD